jgi:hypothetical protein
MDLADPIFDRQPHGPNPDRPINHIIQLLCLDQHQPDLDTYLTNLLCPTITSYDSEPNSSHDWGGDGHHHQYKSGLSTPSSSLPQPPQQPTLSQSLWSPSESWINRWGRALWRLLRNYAVESNHLLLLSFLIDPVVNNNCHNNSQQLSPDLKTRLDYAADYIVTFQPQIDTLLLLHDWLSFASHIGPSPITLFTILFTKSPSHVKALHDSNPTFRPEGDFLAAMHTVILRYSFDNFAFGAPLLFKHMGIDLFPVLQYLRPLELLDFMGRTLMPTATRDEPELFF